jgi:type I restriction enzyme M protein
MQGGSQKQNIEQMLLESANILRATMDVSEYKDYMLGLFFYKCLSDKFLVNAYQLFTGKIPENMSEAQLVYEEIVNWDGFKERLEQESGYSMPPEYTYTKFMEKVQAETFQYEELQKAWEEIMRSAPLMENIFYSVDLDSPRLGTGKKKRNETIMELLSRMDTINFMEYGTEEIGEAYEDAIDFLASKAAKKCGEFFTPKFVSDLMAQIAIYGKEDEEGLSVYDPVMGTGSLMLAIRKFSNKASQIRAYGQEISIPIYNIARMNMLLHGGALENQHMHNANTLDADWPTCRAATFQVVIMDPPYNQNWSAEKNFVNDPRFKEYGELPPKSKADFAFLLHGYHHLGEDGTMVIVLPHGILFRGSKEAVIRRNLLEKGAIYAVIGLPSNIFYSTTIPAVILVLKKPGMNRTAREVLFIDASQEFEHSTRKNLLTERQIANILKLYRERKSVAKRAHLVPYEEIAENEFNLSISSYVDTFIPEPTIGFLELSERIEQTDADLEATKKSLCASLQTLIQDDGTAEQALAKIVKMIDTGER